MPSLVGYVQSKGWSAGEGFIVGNRKTTVPWLTGKAYLPSTALTEAGINQQDLSIVEEKKFEASRTPDRYTAPLFLVREIGSLPCAFLERGFLAFGHQVVSIHAPQAEAAQLRSFHNQFTSNRSALSAFCALLGTRAFTGKATSILKRDIDSLPWPSNDKGWQLSFWEKVLCQDLVEHMADYVRLGQNSRLLRDAASPVQLTEYSMLFVKLLGSVYPNLRAARSFDFDGLTCQAFCFGDAPELRWPGDWKPNLRSLVYSRQGEALRAVRVLRFYEANTILIVKPDRLRYWIRSAAIRDADETLTDLRSQGY